MNYMNNNPIIIGIDHGYGNIKTAHCCFPTGVIISDKEPTFKSNLLVYNGSYCCHCKRAEYPQADLCPCAFGGGAPSYLGQRTEG